MRITRSGQAITRLDYDAGGRLTQRIEGYGTAEARGAAYSYDGLGRLSSVVDPAGLELRYTRDALGRVVETGAYNGGTALAQSRCTYDDAGRLTVFERRHAEPSGDVGDGWVSGFCTYTDAGLPVEVSLEGDVIATYGYDGAMRVTETTAPLGSDFAYSWDGDGLLTEVTESVHDGYNTSYLAARTYDWLGRPVAVAYDDVDDVANPDTTDAAVTEFAYDSLGQCVQVTDAAGLEAQLTEDARVFPRNPPRRFGG